MMAQFPCVRNTGSIHQHSLGLEMPCFKKLINPLISSAIVFVLKISRFYWYHWNNLSKLGSDALFSFYWEPQMPPFEVKWAWLSYYYWEVEWLHTLSWYRVLCIFQSERERGERETTHLEFQLYHTPVRTQSHLEINNMEIMHSF